METRKITTNDGTVKVLEDGEFYKFHLQHLTEIEDEKEETTILTSLNESESHFVIVQFKGIGFKLLAGSIEREKGSKFLLDTDHITKIEGVNEADLPLYINSNPTSLFTEILKEADATRG